MSCNSLIDAATTTSTSVVQLAIDWLDDKDVGDNKTLKYYMYIVK